MGDPRRLNLKTWETPSEEDWIPLSALEHYAYCPRQCALIHVEHVFEENVFTLRGRAVHEQVDTPGTDIEEGLRIERALPLWSRRYGLTGKADIVEFPGGVPYPVDYKHGPQRGRSPADIQLCGQALCLEEMFDIPVLRGAIYHFRSRRRREVEFSDSLRCTVTETIEAIRVMLRSEALPVPPNDHRCPSCSLNEACMPAAGDGSRSRIAARRLFELSIDGTPVAHAKDQEKDLLVPDHIDDSVVSGPESPERH